MIESLEYTLSRPPSCPTNRDHLILTAKSRWEAGDRAVMERGTLSGGHAVWWGWIRVCTGVGRGLRTMGSCGGGCGCW